MLPPLIVGLLIASSPVSALANEPPYPKGMPLLTIIDPQGEIMATIGASPNGCSAEKRFIR